ncbi:MAG: hypothetical protein PHP69_04325 [Candidatus Omnitrophica bacterium]|jgi:hypothetical protein|nr:hypothetical protein [Candidatus Omnitrophota bacterium]MDD5080880.1 hypothetical protein [Candidatus Omnitrophota bacterium]MDD5441485.1 hypothetical protein [Candidatus Omnitrophota bacterium]
MKEPEHIKKILNTFLAENIQNTERLKKITTLINKSIPEKLKEYITVEEIKEKKVILFCKTALPLYEIHIRRNVLKKILKPEGIEAVIIKSKR